MLKNIVLLYFLLVSYIYGSNVACTNNIANDTAAIQNSLNAGGTTTITAGPCAISSVNITINGTNLQGGNFIWNEATNGNVALFVYADNITINQVDINGGLVVFPRTNPITAGRTNITFSNNKVRNVTGGNPASGAGALETNGLHNSVFDGNYFDNDFAGGYVNYNSTAPGRPTDSLQPACWSEFQGWDGVTITNNEFSRCGNDGLHLQPNGSINYAPGATTIAYNKCRDTHRACYEIQGFLNNFTMKGNSAWNYNGPFYNSFAYSVASGGVNFQFYNNLGSMNVANSCYIDPFVPGVGYFLELILRPTVVRGNVAQTLSQANLGCPTWPFIADNWGDNTTNASNTVNIDNNIMCGSSAIVTFTHENNSRQMNYKCGSSDGCTSDTTNYKNTSSCPTALATSSVATPVFVSPPTSFPSGGSGTWNISEVSALPVKWVQFFIDSNVTPIATQELQDLNTSGTFPTDRKWLYHVTYDTSSLSNGSHSLKAIATDVFGATAMATSSFTRGAGTSPSVGLSTLALDYGSVTVGSTTSPQSVTITNTGNATLNISSIDLSGPNSLDYTISANTCGSTLGISSNCSVSVTFTPSANGSRPAFLGFTNDAADSPQFVTLSGTGTGGSSPCANSLISQNCDLASNMKDPWQTALSPYATFAVDTTGLGGLPAMHISAVSTVPPGNNIEVYQDNLSYGANGVVYNVSITMSCSRTQQPNILAILMADPFTTYGTWSGGASNWKPTCTSGTNVYTNTFTTTNNPIPNRGRFTMQWDDAQAGDQIYITNVIVKATASLSISNINILSFDHASVTVQLTCSTACYPYIYYGTTSGGPYQYTSLSYPMTANPFTGIYTTAITISGLDPGTPFYFLPTARPNQDNDTGICNFPGCGSVEQIVTTLPDPPVHPVPPTRPTIYNPSSEPNTTGYATITMQVSGITGECVAASNVTAPGGGGWIGNVTAGDNIQTILSEIGYAAIIDIPQNASCAFPQQNAFNHKGYNITPLALDPAAGGNINSPSHRWIIIQTHQSTSSDFPPFGIQMIPDYSSKLAKFVAQTPGTPTNGQPPGLAVQNLIGQLFDGVGAVHHYWFRNLEMTHLTNGTIYPGNQSDPPAFGPHMRIVPDGAGGVPSYIVIERNYMHGQPWPSRELSILFLQGNNMAVNNNYQDANTSWPGIYPATDPTYASAVITVPTSYFQYNAFNLNPIGPTGQIGMTSPATVTFSGANIGTYTGNFIGWLDSSGLTVGYQSSAGVSVACTGCTATSFSKPTRGQTYTLTALSRSSNTVSFTTDGSAANDAGSGITVTIIGATDNSFNTTCSNLTVLTGTTYTCTQTGANATTSSGFVWIPPSFAATAMWYFSGHFNGSGSAVQDDSVPQRTIPGVITNWRPLGLYHNVVGMTYCGNYIHAIGQTIYSDPYAITSDYNICRNYFYFPVSEMKNSGSWNGYHYSYRNIIEQKIGRRFWVWGNIFDGSSAYQNSGNVIFVPSAGDGPIDSLAGSSDWLIEYNIARHISSGIACDGGGPQRPPDYGMPRMQITNNLFYDLNRDLYNDGGNGFFSGAFGATTNCEDLKIEHNTIALTKGQGPAFHFFGAGGGITGNGATQVMGEGLSWRKNLVVMSLTNQDPLNVIYSQCGQYIASHPANPADVCGNVSTYTQMLNGSYIRAGVSSVVPNWLFDSNILIGGVNTGAAPVYTDVTQSQINTICSTFPTPNTCTAGNTYAARLNVVKWYNPSVDNFANYSLQDASAYSAGNSPYGHESALGADINLINSATGMLTLSGVPSRFITTTGATISYTSADAGVCYVSYSTTNDITTAALVADSGGVVSRTTALTGLTTKTAYYYWVRCGGNSVSSQKHGAFRTN